MPDIIGFDVGQIRPLVKAGLVFILEQPVQTGGQHRVAFGEFSAANVPIYPGRSVTAPCRPWLVSVPWHPVLGPLFEHIATIISHRGEYP